MNGSSSCIRALDTFQGRHLKKPTSHDHDHDVTAWIAFLFIKQHMICYRYFFSQKVRQIVEAMSRLTASSTMRLPCNKVTQLVKKLQSHGTVFVRRSS